MLGGDSNKLSTSGKGNENDIFITGTRGIVNASNSDIVLADHADVTLNGRNNDIVQLGHSLLKGTASGGSLMVWGEENQATISNAFIGVMEGAELELKGTNDRAIKGDNHIEVTGNKNSITIGDHDWAMLGGDSNKLSTSGKGNETLLAQFKSSTLHGFGLKANSLSVRAAGAIIQYLIS